jgi:hypothetical protein
MNYHSAKFPSFAKYALLSSLILPSLRSEARAVEIQIVKTVGTEARVQSFMQERFPILQQFVNEWQRIVDLPNRLRVVFLDSKISTRDRAVLPQVYGDNYKQVAADLLTRIDRENLEAEEIKKVYEEMACAFPGFGMGSALGYWEYAKLLDKPKLLAGLREKLNLILDENLTPREISKFFGRTGASTLWGIKSDCGVLLFGHNSDNGDSLLTFIQKILAIAWAQHSVLVICQSPRASMKLLPNLIGTKTNMNMGSLFGLHLGKSSISPSWMNMAPFYCGRGMRR